VVNSLCGLGNKFQARWSGHVKATIKQKTSVMRHGSVRMIFTKTILILALLASAVTTSFANPAGGGYIQCDPRNPNSPVRCTPDGW